MLIIGKNKAKIKVLKKILIKRFKIKDLGFAKYFVKMKIIQNRKEKTITLCQDIYISKILKQYGIKNYYSVNTPMATKVIKFMVPFNRQATVKNTKLYGLKIGSLIYLAIQTRLDITYRVSILLHFLLNPSLQYIKAID